MSPGPLVVSGENLPEFFCREDTDELIIFFAHPKTKDLKYPMKYGQSLCVEDIEVPVCLNYSGHKMEVSLVFEPYQSLLLRTGRDGSVHFEDIHFMPKPPAVQ